MDEKINKLTDLNYRMLSFIESILFYESPCMEKGKHIMMKEMFMNQFNDIMIKKEDIPTEELSINIHRSDSSIDSDDFHLSDLEYSDPQKTVKPAEKRESK